MSSQTKNDPMAKIALIAGLALIVFTVLVLLNSLKNTIEKNSVKGDIDTQAIVANNIAMLERNIAPIGEVVTGDASAAAASGARSGEEVYTAVCAACHVSGAAGAPKLDDKANWETRVAQGFEGLLNSAINGKGAMPARAGQNIQDDELKSAIIYMTKTAGFDLGVSEDAAPAPEAATEEAAPAETTEATTEEAETAETATESTEAATPEAASSDEAATTDEEASATNDSATIDIDAAPTSSATPEPPVAATAPEAVEKPEAPVAVTAPAPVEAPTAPEAAEKTTDVPAAPETESNTPATPAAEDSTEAPKAEEAPTADAAPTAEKAESAPAAPVVASHASIDGEAIYKQTCFACHEMGVAGAPKIGDKALWEERIAAGAEALYNSAINGKQSPAGVMPAKGGNMSLSDDQIKAAVDYMISKSQ